MASPKVQGVHFVGSIPYDESSTVFTICGPLLGRRLRRLPDGEPGKRGNWILFQRDLFMKYPSSLVVDPSTFAELPAPSLEEMKAAVNELSPINTGYDSAAIESYEQFKAAKQAGQISPQTRFMVAIPTMLGFVGSNIATAWRSTVEPAYTEALQRAIRNIQAAIPHDQLSIQLDCAIELMILDAGLGSVWFPNAYEGCMERIIQLADHVASDVELGFHFCYGDLDHKHFKEPEDLGWINKLAMDVKRRSQHPVGFMQMPVPKNRDDEAYFEPLKELIANQGPTEVYLGLLHPGDAAGTQRRIAAAGKTIPAFGVATECGMGRMTREDADSVMEIAVDVAGVWA